MEVTDKVAWNLSEAIISQLSNLLVRANHNWLTGNFDDAFFSLRAAKMRVIQSLNPDERKALKDIEEEFKQIKTSKKSFPLMRIELSDLHERYNEALMDLLEKYGYTIRKQEDTISINV